MAITAQMQNVPGWHQWEQSVQHAGDRPAVAATGRTRRPSAAPAFLGFSAPAGAGVRHGLQPIDKPGVCTYRQSDAEGQVLGELEGLEVVDDHRLAEFPLEGAQGAIKKKHGMPPEPGRQAGHGGGGAAESTCQLPVGGSRLQTGSDGLQKFRALQIVGEGKRPA
jgi:hypothetical protein